MADNDKALAPAEAKPTALAVIGTFTKDAEAIREFVEDGGLQFSDLPQIKPPAAGGKNWEMPDGSAKQVFKGIVLMQQTTRSYWSPESADNAPPDCSSPEVTGAEGNIGTGFGDNGQPGSTHNCESCPWSQYGSAMNDKGQQTDGQACKLTTNMVVLCDEAGRLPAIVALPPTSARSARQFRNALFRMDKKRHEVVAEFGLVQRGSGQQQYSVADIKPVADLSPDDVAQVEAVSSAFLPAISRMFASRRGASAQQAEG